MPNEVRLRAMADPDRMWALRMKFVEQCKRYYGYPYAKKYWTPEGKGMIIGTEKWSPWQLYLQSKCWKLDALTNFIFSIDNEFIIIVP